LCLCAVVWYISNRYNNKATREKKIIMTNLERKEKKMPVYFISHGGPPIMEQYNDKTYLYWQDFHKELEIEPKAILIISAHWETKGKLEITAADQQELIYDFYGFPSSYYTVKYPAKGDKVLVSRVIDLLTNASITVSGNTNRGLDHGSWIPLKIMYPEAKIPILQLSLNANLSPEYHLAVGHALAPLRDEGVLIIGSGGMTHNFRDFGTSDQYGTEFVNWVINTHELKGPQRETTLSSFFKASIRKKSTPKRGTFYSNFCSFRCCWT